LGLWGFGALGLYALGSELWAMGFALAYLGLGIWAPASSVGPGAFGPIRDTDAIENFPSGWLGQQTPPLSAPPEDIQAPLSPAACSRTISDTEEPA